MNRYLAAVVKSGENFYRKADDLDNREAFRASIIASTRATYSLSARAGFFEGLIQSGVIVGDYLTREADEKIYIVETAHKQPRAKGLDFIYMAQANAIVALARPLNAGADGNSETDWEIYAKDVPVYMDTTTRSLKEQIDGLISNEINIIHIPARFELKLLDRVYLTRTGAALKDCEYFRVDSINEALSSVFGKDLHIDSGVEIMQLSEDRRIGEIINEPEEPTEESPGWWGG